MSDSWVGRCVPGRAGWREGRPSTWSLRQPPSAARDREGPTFTLPGAPFGESSPFCSSPLTVLWTLTRPGPAAPPGQGVTATVLELRSAPQEGGLSAGSQGSSPSGLVSHHGHLTSRDLSLPTSAPLRAPYLFLSLLQGLQGLGPALWPSPPSQPHQPTGSSHFSHVAQKWGEQSVKLSP